jgi:phosphotransferase family enzyme
VPYYASLVPDMPVLAAGLREVLVGSGLNGAPLTILARQPNAYSSTFPSEIVTCQLGDGSELQVLCKYSAAHRDNVYGHKGGGAYEAQVYCHLLQHAPVSVPAFYGAHPDARSGSTWLILEYLDQSIRTNKEPSALPMAARWLGRFHAVSEVRLRDASASFLNTYDESYYQGWVRRTLLFARPLHPRFSWLSTLGENFEGILPVLLAPPVTIIHGEYTPKNILVREGTIYPVDWESAAVAAGEIDLAQLTDRWPSDVARDCEREYAQGRWPDGAPADFEPKLAAARLYLQFRWLGDRPNWTAHEASLWRFEQLRAGGVRLGLIEE